MTLRLDDFTVLEPDVVAFQSQPGDGGGPLSAAAVHLVVEVWVTSRRRDTGLKAGLYAAAGIPDYWVVDPAAGVLLRHTDPADGAYLTVCTVALDGQVSTAVNRLLGDRA